MMPIDGQPILTAAQMRRAEEAAVAEGSSVAVLMERAGAGVAAAVHRLGAGAPVLILCGPGNNGGDGYVAARLLADAGVEVHVAAGATPRSDGAIAARAGWTGAVSTLADAPSLPIVVDALFGIGLSRGLAEPDSVALIRLVEAARLAIAVDLPSGIATDDGAMLSPVPRFDLTLALGAIKPAHLLQPAAGRCGAVRLIDLGLDTASEAHVLTRPYLAAPGPASHKYSRGMVAIVGGAMPGAAELAAQAAMRSGAGYALLLGNATGEPHAIVRRSWSDDALTEKRIGAVVIGPGLGRDAQAERRLDAALASDHPLLIDGDALHLLKGRRLENLPGRTAPLVLTPHAGEFAALFGDGEGSKIDRARDAAARAGAIVVFKGPDTVAAAPNGQVRISRPTSPWLSTAGTGDVLAGTIGAMLAAKLHPTDAAAAGVWLHAEAARKLGGAFIADDLARELSAVRAAL